jgi:quercetin dioxygenase-like cupin family protein
MSLTRGSTIQTMQIWNLRELATPGGTVSPLVLHSGDEGRAVLVGLDAGQELGDHQVKEYAFLLVVDGAVVVSAGEESVEAQAGALFLFEPDERRSVSSAEGARILLVLAPWPGEGHYRGNP